jgi:hypothetical protein
MIEMRKKVPSPGGDWDADQLYEASRSKSVATPLPLFERCSSPHARWPEDRCGLGQYVPSYRQRRVAAIDSQFLAGAIRGIGRSHTRYPVCFRVER